LAPNVSLSFTAAVGALFLRRFLRLLFNGPDVVNEQNLSRWLVLLLIYTKAKYIGETSQQ
jgi:hypothetical protein